MNYLLTTTYQNGRLRAYRETPQRWVPVPVAASPKDIVAITSHSTLPIVYAVHRHSKTESLLTVFALTSTHHFKPVQSIAFKHEEYVIERYALCVVPSRRRLFIATGDVWAFSLNANGHVNDHPLSWELPDALDPFLGWAVSPGSNYVALTYEGEWHATQSGGLAVFYLPLSGKPQLIPVRLPPLHPPKGSPHRTDLHDANPLLAEGTYGGVFLDNQTLLVTIPNKGLVTFHCQPDLVNRPNPVYHPPNYNAKFGTVTIDMLTFDIMIHLPNNQLLAGAYNKYVLYQLSGSADKPRFVEKARFTGSEVTEKFYRRFPNRQTAYDPATNRLFRAGKVGLEYADLSVVKPHFQPVAGIPLEPFRSDFAFVTV